MIVLGPMDADLNGAPSYWRTANWRPYTLEQAPANAFLPTVPFDKCDLVHEYDARRPEGGDPAGQGWLLGGAGSSSWQHDPARGVLRFSIKEDRSFWFREDKTERTPDRAVAYGLFLMERAADLRENPEGARRGGFDFIVEAGGDSGRSRGMRASWMDRFVYRALDGSNLIPVAQPSAEPTLLRAWHQLALDAELVGPRTAGDDNTEPDDGGKTIGSLDGLINNDDRRAFGYGSAGGTARAAFGRTEPSELIEGMLRNYYASFPGRFVRAGFRAVALGPRMRLRLVVCVDADPGVEAGSAAFRVRYSSPSLGLRPAELPSQNAPLAVRQFDAANLGRTVEIPVELDKLRPGEELWFTVERDWSHEADKLRATVHLLQVIVEGSRERNVR